MKRGFSVVLLAFTSSFLLGCNQDRISELEYEASGQQRQLEEYEARISELESSLENGVSSLYSSVASLQGVAADIALAQAMLYSDHSSGGHMIQTAADNLDSAVSELETSISDLSSSL